PVIAVTGTNGKTTTTRLTAHLFRQTGKTVGFTTTDGVYLQDRLVMEGDMTGPFSANIILSNPTVDVAGLETARGRTPRAGAGGGPTWGRRGNNPGTRRAGGKSDPPAVVKREGHAVLNADDPLVSAMRERTTADIVFFSTRPPGENEHFEEHVEHGGIGARI